MKSIGVRELKANISEILREVEEAGEVVEVTRHGRIVARLVPGSWAAPVDRDAGGAWSDLNALAAEISALWPRRRYSRRRYKRCEAGPLDATCTGTSFGSINRRAVICASSSSGGRKRVGCFLPDGRH